MVNWIMGSDDGVVVSVRAKPRAKKDSIEGPTPEGFLAVRLNAPPVDNKANKALVALFAKTLSVPKSAVSIMGGEKSRIKTVAIAGVTVEETRRLLDPSK